MLNIGEEICGEYLKHIFKCDFVTYNVTIPDTQGEIDVIGINLKEQNIYVCEVAIHTGGLQYVTNKRPDNYNRLKAKFDKDIKYIQKYFPTYKNIIPMFWSPIVRQSNTKAIYDTFKELQRLETDIKKQYNLKLFLINNEEFQQKIKELREFAATYSPEFTSNVMRLFQIEGKLEKHISNRGKKKFSNLI